MVIVLDGMKSAVLGSKVTAMVLRVCVTENNSGFLKVFNRSFSATSRSLHGNEHEAAGRDVRIPHEYAFKPEMLPGFEDIARQYGLKSYKYRTI